MKIHTFGDSHSNTGWKYLPPTYNIKRHHLGPKLAYTLGREKTSLLNLNNYVISRDDVIVFCFGEIDCRCHVHKHITPDITYIYVIKNIIDSYIDAVCEIVDQSKIKPKRTCVYNVVPPVNPEERIKFSRSKIFPFIGSDHERKQYTTCFNSLLKQKCKIHDFVFIDVYDDYADSQGFLNTKLSDKSGVHIGDPCHLKKFIDTNIL